mgnify:CR=1 FL=1
MIRPTPKKATLFRSRLAPLLIASTCLTGVAIAQDSRTGEATAGSTNDIIVIEAVRRDVPVEALPNTIQLIEADEIDAQSLFSTNLTDIIGQSVPSFAPSRQKLSGAGESFRGREPLYLVDGVPQSNPLRNGSRDGFTIDPAVIERIEVLLGANAIQGIGATGAVINYVTISPSTEDEWEARAEGQVTVSDGLDGDGTGYRGVLTALRDFGAIDLVASIATESRGAFYDADDRRVGVDGTQGEIQDSLSTNYFVKLGWDIDDLTRLQLMVNLFDLEGDGDYIAVVGDRDAGRPTTAIRGQQEGEAPTNEVETYSLSLTRDDLWGGDLTAEAFYREFESIFGGGTFDGFFNTGTEAPGEETFDQSANNSNKTGAKLTYSHGDLPVDGLTVTGGVDWLQDETFQELIQTGRLWVPEVKFTSLAPFIQFDQLLWGDRVLLSAGVRHEDAKLEVDDYQTIAFYGSQEVSGGEPDFAETLYNVGGSIELTEGVKAYAAYTEGFTMPDLGRVLRAVSEEGQDVDNLFEIQPVIIDNVEVGLSFAFGGFTANISHFWSESDLGSRLVANEQDIFEVRREPTEITGFELSADYQFDAPYTIGGSYAALEGQSDQDGDGAIDEDLGATDIGPDRLNLYVVGEPVENLSFRVQSTSVFDRSFNGAQLFDGYTLVDVSAGYAFGQFGRVDLGVQNALDEDYISYFSQAANTRDDRFFAGRGRTISLKWSKTF